MKDQENEQLDQLFITLGSNINPSDNIKSAILQLKEHFGEIKISKLYKSPAIFGPNSSEPKDDYINGAILTYSNLSPNYIKFEILRMIENKLGRIRTQDRYESRTIDLDIAFYGSLIIDNPNIKIPDADIIQHAHLISPLCDLDPEYIHPEVNISLLKIMQYVDISNIEIFKF